MQNLVRAKTKQGEWVYGNYCCVEKMNKSGYEYILIEISADGSSYEIIRETTGRFVGLHDKTNKSIFVGDVLRNNWGDVYLVVDEGTRLVLRNLKNRVHTWKYVNQYEIIGNIIDNPELFERSKK